MYVCMYVYMYVLYMYVFILPIFLGKPSKMLSNQVWDSPHQTVVGNKLAPLHLEGASHLWMLKQISFVVSQHFVIKQ